MAAAVPIGWACDRFHKPAVLRVNMVFGVASAALLLGGLFGQSSPLLIAAVVAYAAHTQTIAALGPALIAELVESGSRLTQAMGNWMTTRSLAQASGPALQIVAIAAFGKASGGSAMDIEWSLSELLWILVFGLVFLAMYAPYAWRVHHFAPAAPTAGRGEDGSSSARPLSCSQEEAVYAGRRWLYAGLAEAFALITAVGSGMTFKYWPLFFKGDFHFSPAGVCFMQLLIWVAIAAGSQLTPIMARFVGRLPSALLLHLLGTGLLFVISNHSLGPTLEVPLVLVRNCLMNAASPLVQAIILELVPQKHRGKWSSIASLRRVSWSGSALVGGVLSDSHDYRFAFYITACVHSVSGLVLAAVTILAWYRPPWGSAGTDGEGRARAPTTA